MKALGFASLCIILLFALPAPPCHGRNPLTVLHDFRGGACDGESPNAELTLSGSMLYGTTTDGGGSGCTGYGCGIIYSVGTDGVRYKLLHSFAGGGNDGAFPRGKLILSGSTLYGTTGYGGGTGCNGSGCGTIFSINTDGSDYKLLHAFAGGGNDGDGPGSLILSGSTLYGTTGYGGGTGCNGSGCGTIFSINTDGSDYKLLYSFGGSPEDGAYPSGRGRPILRGVTLYGTTVWGGGSDRGSIFSINTDGSGYKLLHSFSGGENDGSYPGGGFLLSGSTLYGGTGFGGGSICETIYSINTDGSNYRLLHSFAGYCSGATAPLPTVSLVLSGSALYGTSSEADGTVFSMNVDGTNYRRLHSFAAKKGLWPTGDVLLSGSTLFGTTTYGGRGCEDMGCGIVFSFRPTILRVTKSGTGKGAVSSSPSGIECGTVCDSSFAGGTGITLTASAEADSTFTGWSGGGCIGKGACKVTMNNNVNVRATFAIKQLAVHASVQGGHGRVNPASRKVSYGGSASIAIIPNKGYRVAGITDNGQSMPVSNSYIIGEVTADHNIVVVFTADE